MEYSLLKICRLHTLIRSTATVNTHHLVAKNSPRNVLAEGYEEVLMTSSLHMDPKGLIESREEFLKKS